MSVSHSLWAAALAKLGQIEEAKAAAQQALALDHPSFSAAKFRATRGLPIELSKTLSDAWSAAGLRD
jgi:predicted RNA polymerase sigma factor